MDRERGEHYKRSHRRVVAVSHWLRSGLVESLPMSR
jgi:hypothetical protein